MKNQTLPSITRILFLITLLCAAIASLQSVHAVTITVTSTADSGANTLRQALADSNDGDTIDFSVTGTITLSSGELLVNDSITISGPGADILAVDANHASRVFHIASGKTVTISGLTITNGAVTGSFPAGAGGGIFNDHSTLTINNSTLSGNSASWSGGGIYSQAGFGSATLTINNSTFSSNSAPGSVGGGIFNDGRNSGSAALTVSNSTLSGNSATSVGGINNQGFGGSATLTIRDTILKTGPSGENIFNDSGMITSLGYNLSSDDASAVLNQSTDQNSIDPMLGPLQDNGGPTFTHGLSAGSPAIDKGKNFTTATTDQRGTGFAHTYDNPAIANATGGDGTDIGAFEVQASPAVCPQPHGYWKNNPDAWPVNSLMLGSQTYSKTELLTILKTRIGSGPKADASLILADQLIAAKLNIANGADGTAVTSTITHADSVLSGYSGKLPYKVRTNTTNGRGMVNDAATLESYNKGALTLGCGL